MTVMDAPSGLLRKSLGTGALITFCATASSPMAVLAGGIVATYATTGVVAVPLGFVVLAAALLLFTVGYTAMVRYVPSAGVFYSAVAAGFGRFWGVVAAPVVLLAYNTIQISLYGFLGAVVSSSAGGPWWLWALIAWVLVGTVGVLRARISVGLLATVLVIELAVILLLDAVAFANPAGDSISTTPLSPANLLEPGVGGVFALCAAAFVGYESAAVYSEEADSPRSVARATYAALILLGILYAVSAWAVAAEVGPTKVVDEARDPNSGLPFSILGQHVNPILADLAALLIVTSVFAAMVSFHNSVARYAFSLGRERVLPGRFEKIGRGGAPVAGSLLQSGLALAMILLFAAAGADPVAAMFTWLSTIAAVAVMLLMATTSVAAVLFFKNGGGTNESVWQRVICPGAGAIVVASVLATTVFNLNSVLGVPPGSASVWVVPSTVVAAGIVGLIWALILRSQATDALANVGRGQPQPLAVIEQDIANLRL